MLGEPWGDGSAVAIIAVDFGFNLFVGSDIIHGIAIYTYSGSKNHGDPCTLVLQEKGNFLEIVLRDDAICGHPCLVCLIPLLACTIVDGIDVIYGGGLFVFHRGVGKTFEAVLCEPFFLSALVGGDVVAAGSDAETVCLLAVLPIKGSFIVSGHGSEHTMPIGEALGFVGASAQWSIFALLVHGDFELVGFIDGNVTVESIRNGCVAARIAARRTYVGGESHLFAGHVGNCAVVNRLLPLIAARCKQQSNEGE